MIQSKTGVPGQGLLDRLAEMSRLLYLSDLRTARSLQAVLTSLYAIAADEYTAKEWNQAAAYILYEDPDLQDPAEAREYLVKQLKQKRDNK